MRSQKRSRRIVHGDVEYRWRATGNDGYISIGIWPTNNIGPFIYGNFRYHETPEERNQIVITNRIIRRIIEHARAAHGYDPQVAGNECRLIKLDDVIKWDDALRGSRNSGTI